MPVIPDWRQSWRLLSVRVCAFGAALFAFLLAAPDQALAIWQALPPELQALVPNRTQVSLFLFAAVAIARVLRQGGATPAAPMGLMAVPAITPAAKAPAWRAAAAVAVHRGITHLVVHCAATPAGKIFHAADIRSWHLRQGWADIGYHFVIDLDGTIEVGRPLDRAGAHVTGFNAHSIGICYIGGVSADGKTPTDTRTPAQKAALIELLRALKGRWPQALILGHRDFPRVAKACPSFDAKREYVDLRA